MQYYLHNTNNGAAIIRKINDSSDNISRIEKGLSMSGQKHEETHNRHARSVDCSCNSKPEKEVTGEALDCAGGVDRPWSGAAGDGGVEEAGDDTGVSADVLEDGDGVESGLGIGLCGFQNWGVDSERV